MLREQAKVSSLRGQSVTAKQAREQEWPVTGRESRSRGRERGLFQTSSETLPFRASRDLRDAPPPRITVTVGSWRPEQTSRLCPLAVTHRPPCDLGWTAGVWSS